jgi:peroxiredoxin Q/BCP
VRELREFRALHSEFEAKGITVAGMTRDGPASNKLWADRLHLPYPLLSDVDGDVGRGLGVMRRIGIASWTLELYRRKTMLVDGGGLIAAVWDDVKVRGHAREVLQVASALPRAID